MVSRNVKVLVYGRVQGVYFRYYTKLMADSLGLCGWVKNCPDGSVETHLSGSEHNVNEMIDWLHQGPDSAAVDKVDIAEIDSLEKSYDGFMIRH